MTENNDKFISHLPILALMTVWMISAMVESSPAHPLVYSSAANPPFASYRFFPQQPTQGMNFPVSSDPSTASTTPMMGFLPAFFPFFTCPAAPACNCGSFPAVSTTLPANPTATVTEASTTTESGSPACQCEAVTPCPTGANTAPVCETSEPGELTGCDSNPLLSGKPTGRIRVSGKPSEAMDCMFGLVTSAPFKKIEITCSRISESNLVLFPPHPTYPPSVHEGVTATSVGPQIYISLTLGISGEVDCNWKSVV